MTDDAWPCTPDGPGRPPPCGEVCDTCPIPIPDRADALARLAEGLDMPVEVLDLGGNHWLVATDDDEATRAALRVAQLRTDVWRDADGEES